MYLLARYTLRCGDVDGVAWKQDAPESRNDFGGAVEVPQHSVWNNHASKQIAKLKVQAGYPSGHSRLHISSGPHRGSQALQHSFPETETTSEHWDFTPSFTPDPRMSSLPISLSMLNYRHARQTTLGP
jgi:hypothetical protein